jgi:drug/metabolite transporter (DMT)-like permease
VQLALILAFVVNVVWGASLPATKVGLSEFTPLVFAWLRLTVSTVLFVALLAARSEFRTLGRRDWLMLLGLGLVGYGGNISLQTLGAHGTTAASGSVLSATGPFFIALLAPYLLHERPEPRAILGILVCLGGIFLVLGIDPTDPSLRDVKNLAGNALVLASAACVGFFAVFGKRLGRRHSPLVVSGVTCLSGTAALTIPALGELSAISSHPTILGWTMVLFLGAVVTVTGMSVWFWVLGHLPASRASVFLFIQAVSGIALSSVVLGDALSAGFVAGTALVLGGLALVTATPGEGRVLSRV